MGLSVAAYEAEVAEQAKRAAFWAVPPAPSAAAASSSDHFAVDTHDAARVERDAAEHRARAEANHARDLKRFATSTSMDALLMGDQSPPLLRHAPRSAVAGTASGSTFGQGFASARVPSPYVSLDGDEDGGPSYASALRFDHWGVAPRGAAAGAAAATSCSPSARDARNVDDADPRAALRSVDTYVSAQLESDVASVLANIAMM